MQSLLSASDLIDRSAQWYRHAYRVVLGALLPAIGGTVLLSIATPLIAMFFGESTITNTVLNTLVNVIMTVCALLSVIHLYRVFLHANGMPQLSTRWKETHQRFWPMLAVTAISGLCIALASLAVIVPGIIVWVWLGFTAYFCATGSEWKQAFRESRALSRNRFFPVLWRLLAPTLFFGFFQLVLVGGTVLLSQGLLRGVWSIDIVTTNAPWWFLTITLLLSGLVQAILSPLTTIATALLAHNLQSSHQ